MKKYYIESRIGNIAKEILQLVENGVINDASKIILYGLDTYSYAMKTILANHGFKVDCYICDDRIKVMAVRRHKKAFAARHANYIRDFIGAYSLEERLIPYDKSAVILVASPDYDIIKRQLEGFLYRENAGFYCVCNWEIDDFSERVREKKEVTLPEIHNSLKEMLKDVDKFCCEHNIRYWVCGGTLLGTIRHKGFIPWDDDIDIFMPWNDYQLFVQTYSSERYELIGLDKTNCQYYNNLFSKIIDYATIGKEDTGMIKAVRPLALDVFPLIGLPNDSNERREFFADYAELESCITEDFYANDGSLGVYSKWYPKQKEFLEKYDFDKQNYVGVLATVYKDRDCTTRDVYNETIRMPFEDIEVNVPIGYKEYLDNLYGQDWMQLPEESKRVAHIGKVVYWL